MAKVCSRLAAPIPSFDDSADTLAEGYRVRLAKGTIRATAEAAGATLLEQEDAYRQRIRHRREPWPGGTQQPAQAWVFADGTAVPTEGDGHAIRVATVTPGDAAGPPLARHSRARFVGVGDVAWTWLRLVRSVGYPDVPNGRSSPTGRPGGGSPRRAIAAVPRRSWTGITWPDTCLRRPTPSTARGARRRRRGRNG